MEQKLRKPIAWLLTLALIFTMLPGFTFTALAADSTTYNFSETPSPLTINSSNKDQYNGATITGELTLDTAGNISDILVIDGVTVDLTIEDLNLKTYLATTGGYSPIDLTNGATLNLTVKGSNTLTVGWHAAGIHVPAGCTLNITSASTGTLTVTGGGGYGGGAGIGADGNGMGAVAGSTASTTQTCGTINIAGGTVIATGGTHVVAGGTGLGGAGIGGSSAGTSGGAASTGSITITGGNVTATGGGSAAGIGGGESGYVESINITGGTVKAIAEYGAAIGTGQDASSNTDIACGDSMKISIDGGVVIADGNIGYGDVVLSTEKITGGSVTIGTNASVMLTDDHIINHGDASKYAIIPVTLNVYDGRLPADGTVDVAVAATQGGSRIGGAGVELAVSDYYGTADFNFVVPSANTSGETEFTVTGDGFSVTGTSALNTNGITVTIGQQLYPVTLAFLDDTKFASDTDYSVNSGGFIVKTGDGNAPAAGTIMATLPTTIKYYSASMGTMVVWLASGTYNISIQSSNLNNNTPMTGSITVPDSTTLVMLDNSAADTVGTLDLSYGPIKFYKDGDAYKVDYTPSEDGTATTIAVLSTAPFVVTQSGETTTNTITVEDWGSTPLKLTINSLNINADIGDEGSESLSKSLIDISGSTVELTLEGVSTLTSNVTTAANRHVALLGVDGTSVLTVTKDSNGSLTATAAGGRGAVIGGAGVGGTADGVACGIINIKGGTIAAVIGDEEDGRVGYGAAIGSGRIGTGGTVNISGGEVTATSHGAGAAIGSGTLGTSFTVNVSGGKVIARNTYGSSGGGAAIGSGSNGAAYVIISGGEVEATAFCGAAIGSGDSGDATVAISDGTVIAYAAGSYAYGAGIGSGAYGEATVTISGGSITASTGGTSGTYAAAIGGGGSGNSSTSNATVTITGGDINATGSSYTPAIGSGYSGSSNANATVSISGGNINVDNDTVATIGLGGGNNSTATVTITGGSVNGKKRTTTTSFTDGNSNEVYLITATLSDADAAVTGSITGENYSFNGVKTNSEGKIFLWLPESSESDPTKATFNGGSYTGMVKTSNDSEFVSDKPSPTVTAPTANTLTYDGTAQALVTAGSTTGGTLQYALGTDGTNAPADGWGDAIPTGTNAGTYYVWYKVVGNEDYADVAAMCVTVNISQRAITIKADDQTVLPNNQPDSSKISVTSGSLVDGHTLTATLKTVTDVATLGTQTGALKIDTFTIKSGDTDVSNNYNVTPATGDLTVANHTHDWSYELTTTNTTNDTIKATCSSGFGTCTAENNTATITLNKPARTTYGDWEKSERATITVDPIGVLTDPDVIYSGRNNTTYGPSESAPTDAGDYTASITMGEGDNAKTASVTYTIERAGIYGAFITTEIAPVVGEAPAADVNDGEDYTAGIEWNCDTETFGFNTAYTATVTLTADSNHKFTNTLVVDGWTVESVSANGTTAILTKTFDATRKEQLTGIGTLNNAVLDKYYTNAADAAKELPATVTYTSESGNDVTADIEWACENYNTATKAINTFTWSVKDGELDNYDVNGKATSGSITVTNVDALPVTNTGSDTEITYDGNTYDVSTMFTKDENAGEASYAITGGTGVGTLDGSTLTITKAGTIEITMSTAANGAYANGSATVTLTVNKANAAVTTAPTANDLTHTGSAQELVTAGEAKGGEMQYALGVSADNAPTDGWAATVPTAIDVGTYYVWYKVVGDDNHSDVDAACITVTISPKTYTVTYAPGANGTGDQTTATKTHGTALTLKGAIFTRIGYTQTGWAAADGGALAYALGASYTADAAITLYPVWTANTYTVTYTDNVDDEVIFDDMALSATYGSKAPTFGIDPARTGYTFGGWYTDRACADADKWDFNNNTVTGNITLYAKWTEKAEVSISEAVQTYTWDNDAPKSFVISGTPNTGFTVQYKVNNNWTATAPSAVSTYDVKITRAEDNTYKAYEKEITGGLVINAATPTVKQPSAKTDLVFNDSEQYLINAGSSDHGYWEYSLDDTTYSANIPKGADAKAYTVYCRFVPNAGYSDIDPVQLSVTIAPLAVDEPTVVGSYTYNGNEQTVELDGFNDSYMTITGGSRGTGANDYEVRITLNRNYVWKDSADGKIEWSIGKAEPIVTWPTGKAYVNDASVTLTDGSAAGVGAETSIVGDFVLETVDLTSAGIKTVKITFKPTSTNYKNVEKTDYTVTVSKRTVESVAVQTSITNAVYGTEQNALGLPATVEITVGGNKKFTVPVTWSDYDKTNLNAQTLTGTLDLTAIEAEVQQAAPAITASIVVDLQEKNAAAFNYENKTATYNGSPISHEISGELEGVASISYSYVGTGETEYAVSATAPTNAGTYEVTATFTMEAGYASVAPKTATLTIEAKEIGLDWSELTAAELVYSGTAKTLTAAATGLADGDSCTVTVELVGDNINVGTFSYKATALSNKNYKLPADVNSPSYTITPKSLTITAEDKEAYVGSRQPELTYTVDGLVGSDTLTTAPTLTTDANMYRAGTYAITFASEAAAGSNYSITYVNGTLTVKSYPYVPQPTYDVEIADDITGGEVSANKKVAYKGDTITVTIDPDAGYELTKLTVTDSRGNVVAVTKISDSKYTFKMPGYDVKIDAVYAKIDTTCPRDWTCPMYGYTDLDRTAWYHDGVHFCIANGLMQGVGNNQFNPNGTTTRAMIVTILWRLEGSPAVNYAMDFEDVAAGQWYTEAIRWAASEKIVEGYGNGKFGTNDPITREQFVTIMFRYAKYKGYDVSVGENTNILSYDDAFDVASWAIPAMQWACGESMIQGIADGSKMNLAPQGNATRAQAAAILQRFIENVVKEN